LAEPKMPAGLPLRTCLNGGDGQQRIGIVAFGSLAQRLRILALRRLSDAEHLLAEIRQWQAQRQPAMLSGHPQRTGLILAVANQARALTRIDQPPAQDARAISAPQGQPGPAQAALGGLRIEERP